MQYYWLGPRYPIFNMQYYWVGPLYSICNITGLGPHHPILNMRYYWAGPSYSICDITGWAHHIQYAILLSWAHATRYSICDIPGWAHCMKYYWLRPHHPMFNTCLTWHMSQSLWHLSHKHHNQNCCLFIAWTLNWTKKIWTRTQWRQQICRGWVQWRQQIFRGWVAEKIQPDQKPPTFNYPTSS